MDYIKHAFVLGGDVPNGTACDAHDVHPSMAMARGAPREAKAKASLFVCFYLMNVHVKSCTFVLLFSTSIRLS